jgi:hypothetical protein
MKIRFAAGTALIAALLAPPLVAQQPVPVPLASQPPDGRKLPAPIPLRVTVVLSRHQGNKQISSMPYVLGVMASGWGPGPKTTLRMGVNVPVAQTVFGGSGDAKTVPMSSYTYRDVGTNIDCGATFDQAVPGLFQLAVTVSDSSLGLDSPKRSGVAPDTPTFRNFNSAFTALLRDGQTMQYTSATDPVSGDVMKIDITVNVMK